MKKFLSTVWSAGYPVLISIGINLLCTFFAVLFFAGMFYRQTGMVSVEIAAEVIDSNILLLTGVVSLLIIPLFMLMISKDEKRFGEDSTDVKLKPKTIIICIAGACGVAFALTLLLRLAVNVVSQDAALEEVGEIFDDAAPLVMIAVSLIFGPLCDELLFRGLVFKRIDRAYGFFPAAVISSLVYALHQGNNTQAVYCFLLGMMLCQAYEKTEKVWIPVVMHMSASTFVLVMNYAVDSLISAGGKIQLAAAIGGIIAGAALAVAAVLILSAYKGSAQSAASVKDEDPVQGAASVKDEDPAQGAVPEKDQDSSQNNA